MWLWYVYLASALINLVFIVLFSFSAVRKLRYVDWEQLLANVVVVLAPGYNTFVAATFVALLSNALIAELAKKLPPVRNFLYKVTNDESSNEKQH